MRAALAKRVAGVMVSTQTRPQRTARPVSLTIRIFMDPPTEPTSVNNRFLDEYRPLPGPGMDNDASRPSVATARGLPIRADRPHVQPGIDRCGPRGLRRGRDLAARRGASLLPAGVLQPARPRRRLPSARPLQRALEEHVIAPLAVRLAAEPSLRDT